MIIRVQSPQGTKRIEIDGKSSMILLHQKVAKTFGLVDASSWKMFRDRGCQDQVPSSCNSLDGCGFRHGDMIYMQLIDNNLGSIGESSQLSTSTNQIIAKSNSSIVKNVKEEEIDILLWKEDGRIKRGEPSSSGIFKMDHLSIEPWDEEYLKEKEIKFLSFHAYMRKQRSGPDKGKYFHFKNFRAASKVEQGNKKTVLDIPSAVTLNRQKYRFVDNIVFENQEVCQRFINFWIKTGHQRMGYLYGRYSKHSDVPLGIKAEVCAIYEPPQLCSSNKIELRSDPYENVADEIAKKLGLTKVGWIISDLVADGNQKVKYLRNPDTHFLSAEECITAAHFQNKHLNPCRLASEGTFGSKFVTVVVSGDKDKSIAFQGYQVSTQCMSLVADNCLIPTLDAPELGYIKESSSELIVSEVYYREKDKYGNEVQKIARPLPLEYLLTDIPAAVSVQNKYTATSLVAEFPGCNRLHEAQTLSKLSQYLKQFSTETFVDALSDFNVLVFLATNDTIPLMSEMGPLLDAVRDHDNLMALNWGSTCESWSTLEEIMKHADDSMQTSPISNSANMDAEMREAIERSLHVQ